MQIQGGIDVAAANKAARSFAAALDVQTVELAKAATVEAGKNLQWRIEGGTTNPRRIDTGETRDGWNLAVEQATGRSVGPTSAAPPGGGVGSLKGSGHKATVILANTAPQAHYVEDGAPNMRPGYHVRDMSRWLDNEAAKLADPFMVAAWEAA